MTKDLFGDLAEPVGAAVPAVPAVPPAPAEAPAIAGLVWRPSIHARGEAAWLSARAWRATQRRDQLKCFKLAKQSRDATVIDAAAADLAALILAIVGKVGIVTCVPCGHSRRPDCFGYRLASSVAALVQAPFLEAWAFRPVSGSSHPKQFSKLPKLVRQSAIADRNGTLLVVDDLVTSGFHMAEALADARAQGASALGAAWINGTVAR